MYTSEGEVIMEKLTREGMLFEFYCKSHRTSSYKGEESKHHKILNTYFMDAPLLGERREMSTSVAAGRLDDK